jgi:hypothetical protein
VGVVHQKLQRSLLLLVVLRNTSVSTAAPQLGLSPALATQKLVEALDVLAGHFDIRHDYRQAAGAGSRLRRLIRPDGPVGIAATPPAFLAAPR